MFTRLKLLMISQITQGVSAKSLALSGALALTLGTFPIAGGTSIVLIVASYYLRLNQPLMQALNHLMTPLFLLMIPVYVRVGEWILGAPRVTINPAKIVQLFFSDWRLFFEIYGLAAAHAVLAWTLIAPPTGFALYFVLLPFFTRLQRRFRKNSLPLDPDVRP